MTDFEAHIKFEETYTPLSWRKRYNLMNGSTHGLSHTLTQMAYFRPSNRLPRYQNLYFVGASTHPGTGVPSSPAAWSPGESWMTFNLTSGSWIRTAGAG